MKSHARLIKPEVPAAFTSLFDSLFSVYNSLSSIQQKQVLNAIDEGKQTILDRLSVLSKSANAGINAVSKDVKKRPGVYIAGAAGVLAGLAFLGWAASRPAKKSGRF